MLKELPIVCILIHVIKNNIFMNKRFLILFFTLFSLCCFSQNEINKSETLYLYVPNNAFIGGVLGYKAYFTIASKDKRFSHDNYYFYINYGSLDYKSLYNLGEEISVNSIEQINPGKLFKDLDYCELHSALSLYKRIYIVTDIPKSKLKSESESSKKYMKWLVDYSGSIKNVVHTNMTGKNLIDD